MQVRFGDVSYSFVDVDKTIINNKSHGSSSASMIAV